MKNTEQAEYIRVGFLKLHHDLTSAISWFWLKREELYYVKRVPMKKNTILIPWQLRAEVLKTQHSVHQGVNGMLANARKCVFWPGLNACVRTIPPVCKSTHSSSGMNLAEEHHFWRPQTQAYALFPIDFGPWNSLVPWKRLLYRSRVWMARHKHSDVIGYAETFGHKWHRWFAFSSLNLRILDFTFPSYQRRSKNEK